MLPHLWFYNLQTLFDICVEFPQRNIDQLLFKVTERLDVINPDRALDPELNTDGKVVDAKFFTLFTLGRFNYGLDELVVVDSGLRSISDTLKREENESSVARSRHVYMELVVEALLII